MGWEATLNQGNYPYYPTLVKYDDNRMYKTIQKKKNIESVFRFVCLLCCSITGFNLRPAITTISCHEGGWVLCLTKQSNIFNLKLPKTHKTTFHLTPQILETKISKLTFFNINGLQLFISRTQ